MMTPAATWLAAANAGAEPCFLLSITDGVTTWKCTSSATTAFASDVALVNVSSVGSECDPLTREMQSAECTVDVLDGWIRPLVINNRLKGKQAVVKYGFCGIPEADFISYATGPIEEMSPSGQKDSGVWTLSIMDLFTVMQAQEFTASWIGKHPLECLYDGATGKSILSRCGFNNSTYADESTFDPTDAAYASSIGHWCVSRIQDFDIYEKVSAFDLVKQLCQLMTGQIVSDETGQLVFKRFDSTAAAVDTWTVDDVIEGSFKQDPLDANVVNQVKVKFGKTSDTSDHPEMTLVINDTDSQTAYAYPGLATRVITHEVETSWCPSYHVVPTVDVTGGATSITMVAQLHGFAGCRGARPGPQAASAQLSADRPAYFWIDNVIKPGSEAEIIKCVTAATINAGSAYAHWLDWQNGTWTDTAYANSVTFNPVVRGQLGTSAVAHTKSSQTIIANVWDVTMIVDMAQQVLRRFKYGCPIVSLETPAVKMPVQQGDIINLTWPDFAAYGTDGSTTESWEVIAKEPDLMASPPVIRWKLALASGVVAWNPGANPRGPSLPGPADKYRGTQGAEEMTRGFAATGSDVSATAGLGISIAAGAIVSGPMRFSRATAQTMTMTASKDTYLARDPATGDVAAYEVANGAAAPTKDAAEVWLAKVVSNGAAVTGVTDLRETLPYNFDKVKDGATWIKVQNVSAGHQVVAGSIATDAVEEAKIKAGAVTEGKVGAGAITEGKLGAAAVTAGKIGAQAVGAAAVADGAIGGVHVAQHVVGAYANGNAYFGKRTRQ